MTSLSYAVITPALNEAEDIGRLASCLFEQSVRPSAWVIVEQGSTDGTQAVVQQFAQEQPWVRLVPTTRGVGARGAPIVRAFHAGVAALDPPPDVVAKVDADISMDPQHFERLLEEFSRDSRLGIAGGIGYEENVDHVWRQRHGTGPGVWGACRAYRRECLAEVGPLEEHMGWDTLDLMKAEMKGWRVRLFLDLAFRHHRREGVRDGGRLRTWSIQGAANHFMGYRVSYLLIRTGFRMLSDPAAIGLLFGYLNALAHRRPRCADVELRAYIRSEQSVRRLPIRVREALRPRAALTDPLRR